LVPIDAESRGKARELLRRIHAEDVLAFTRLKELLKPLEERQRRLPGRKARPEHLVDLARDWQQMPHQTYRLTFGHGLLGRGRGVLTEIRLSTGHTQDLAWEDAGEERAAYAIAVTVLADKGGIDMSAHPIYAISEHALGRRFQRGRKREYADILADLVPIVPPTDLALGAEWAMPVAEGGEWRGLIVSILYGDRDAELILSIRTYLSD
jgi:hypothetical protein